MHIPPGIQVVPNEGRSWMDKYTQTFIDIILEYQTKIIGIMTGHYHIGTFELIGSIPVINNPSISPIFGNNPTFRYYIPSESNYMIYTLNAYNNDYSWYESSFIKQLGYGINFARVLNDLESGVLSLENYLNYAVGFWVVPDRNYTVACYVYFGNICNKGAHFTLQILICSIKYPIWNDFSNCIEDIRYFI